MDIFVRAIDQSRGHIVNEAVHEPNEEIRQSAEL